MFDLHVPAKVPLQVELTGAVRTLEGLTASMKVHVAQKIVHSVERLATNLQKKINKMIQSHNILEHRHKQERWLLVQYMAHNDENILPLGFSVTVGMCK